MKKLLIIMGCVLSIMTVTAQSEKFLSIMKTNITAIDSSFKNPDDLIKLSNTFERIAVAENTQWLPYYYAAFLQVNLGFMTSDKLKKDLIADKAEQLINKADLLAPDNSEISTIKSMIASCRLMADPMSRYMEFGPISAEHIEAAIRQDPSNPRPYFLKGQNLKYTPEQFGGGCNAAKPQLDIAIDKFGVFQPLSPIHPVWGKERTVYVLNECK